MEYAQPVVHRAPTQRLWRALGLTKLRIIQNDSIVVLGGFLLAARQQMLIVIAAFTVSTYLLGLSGYVGRRYPWVITVIGTYWPQLSEHDFETQGEELRLWAKRQFNFSVPAISVVSPVLAIDYVPRALLRVRVIMPDKRPTASPRSF